MGDGESGGNMPDMENFPGTDDGESNRHGNRSEEAGENSDEAAMPAEEADEDSSEEMTEGLLDSQNDAAEEETEESSIVDDRMNQEQITLTVDDLEEIETFIPGLSGSTISYTTKSSVEGGNLTEAQTYTIAGVKESYYLLSNLSMAEGEFITESDDDNQSRVCVLGASLAKELFGSAQEAYGSTLYIDDRTYTVSGVLASSTMISAGITPDETLFIPYETGIKYITGEDVSPVITVVSEDVNAVDSVIEDLKVLLAERYNNAEFTYSDAGSKMEAAESSNEILTVLLAAMAIIVFIIGGIGIMNVLFVSVKERTNEIGILKALGASRRMILFEFLIESAAISFLGGVLGVALSFAITPVVEYYGVRVEANASAWLAALGFAVLTGTIFGFYPAWKASRLIPVDALQAE